MGIHPIVSSCESPTENISQFIDYWLQPIMKALPSYIKDTTQLINQLSELTIEPNTPYQKKPCKYLSSFISNDTSMFFAR